MKRMTVVILSLIAVALVRPARAVEPLTFDDEGFAALRRGHAGPAQQKLEALASGECTPETCFDGAPILRREGPLAILEEKKTGEYYIPPHYDNHVRCFHGGRGEGGGDCYDYPRYEPGRLVSSFHQKVGIADRESYVKDREKSGNLKGGLFGLIGLLGFLAGPIVGLGILAASVTTGILVGGKVAGDKARAKPDVFERDVTTEQVGVR